MAAFFSEWLTPTGTHVQIHNRTVRLWCGHWGREVLMKTFFTLCVNVHLPSLFLFHPSLPSLLLPPLSFFFRSWLHWRSRKALSTSRWVFFTPRLASSPTTRCSAIVSVYPLLYTWGDSCCCTLEWRVGGLRWLAVTISQLLLGC